MYDSFTTLQVFWSHTMALCESKCKPFIRLRNYKIPFQHSKVHLHSVRSIDSINTLCQPFTDGALSGFTVKQCSSVLWNIHPNREWFSTIITSVQCDCMEQSSSTVFRITLFMFHWRNKVWSDMKTVNDDWLWTIINCVWTAGW